MKTLTKLIFLFVLVLGYSCDEEVEPGVMKSDLSKDVEMITNYGTIIMRLSDETPLHRNNFIKLVNEKFYDSLLFHRVIENFIIQTGDPESKNPDSDKTLGHTDLPYRVDAEFSLNLFHKRGALNAAREGDDTNPNQASSSTQFTIVQGRVYNDSTLDHALSRINKWLAYNNVINDSKHKTDFEQLQEIIKTFQSQTEDDDNEENKNLYEVLKSKLDSLTDLELETMEKYAYPDKHRDIYKTLGGAAHLDRNYTVFGEVVQGMEVVDSIAAVETSERDVPTSEVRIITAKMIKRKNY